MKNLSLKNKILAVIAVLLCIVIIGAVVHLITTIQTANKAAAGEDLSSYDVVFTGNINIYDEEYDIVLKGKNGQFNVDAGNLKNVMDGKYTFTDGQGWTFVFNDSLGTNVRSQYDQAEKVHRFIYSLNLGSRGTGNVLLANEDKSFKAAETSWQDIPAFTGNAAWFGGVLNATTICACDADGNFKIFCTGGEIDVIKGSYELSGDNYVFTAENGTVYTTEIAPDSGLPSFTVAVHRPSLEAYGAADTEAILTLQVLSVEP